MEQKIDKIVEIAKKKMNISEDKAREKAESIIPKLKRRTKITFYNPRISSVSAILACAERLRVRSVDFYFRNNQNIFI